jgi:hypothetical protein
MPQIDTPLIQLACLCLVEIYSGCVSFFACNHIGLNDSVFSFQAAVGLYCISASFVKMLLFPYETYAISPPALNKMTTI